MEAILEPERGNISMTTLKFNVEFQIADEISHSN
jgi:hypothetical protein